VFSPVSRKRITKETEFLKQTPLAPYTVEDYISIYLYMVLESAVSTGEGGYLYYHRLPSRFFYWCRRIGVNIYVTKKKT
jgi:hypothetical protein